MKSQIILLAFWVLIPSIWTFEMLLPQIYNDSNLYTIPCITRIFQKYFTLGEQLTGSALLVSIDDSYSLLQEYILRNLNDNELYGWTVIIQNPKNELSIGFGSLEKVKNYLIFFDYADDVEEVIEYWKALPTWNSFAKLLIVLTSEQHPILFEANVKNLIQLILKNKVFNANIVSQEYLENSVLVSTFYPYEDNSCLNSSSTKYLKVTDSCKFDDSVELTQQFDNIVNMTELLNVILGNIPENLHQCPLKVQARIWEPYTIYDEDLDDFIAGIDVMIIKTIADKLNMTANIMLQNTSTYYVFQQLIENDIDMIIGGVGEDPGISDLISSSIPYYQDDMTWCVRKADRFLPWMKFLTLFDLMTWGLIFVTMLTSSALIFYLNKNIQRKSNFFFTFLEIGCLLVGQSFNFVGKTLLVRMLFFFIFCFTHTINTTYQTFLISSLTRPQAGFQISTAQEILKNSMRVTGDIDVVQYLNKKGKVYEYFQNKISICQNIESCIKEVVNDSNLAIAMSRENTFYNPQFPRDKLFCFPQSEYFYSYLISILMPKDYHLLERVNNVVQLVIESGHIVKWTREIKNNITLKEELKKNTIESKLVLNIGQLKGPFILWIICVIISSFVFIMELQIHRMSKKKMKKKFWIVMDNFMHFGNFKETESFHHKWIP